MTFSIDVTDIVEFISNYTDEDDLEPTMMIRCVCSNKFEYPENMYDEETRRLWSCPECGAQLYFVDSGDSKNKIMQVIDD